MNSKPYLVFPGLKPTVWSHGLEQREQFLGRSSKCDIRLLHSTVSSRHAVIWGAPGSYFVRDLDSANGTFVNAIRIQESPIEVGMRIRFGKVVLDVIDQKDYDSNTAFYELQPTELIRSGKTEPFAHCMANLSDGQQRVLQLLLKGLNEKKVAEILDNSEHTVHTHIKNIYRTLGVHSRSQLMARVFAQSDR